MACVPASLSATDVQTPVLELDHVYIVVSPGAHPELQALRRVGLVLDSSVNRHDGEGPASGQPEESLAADLFIMPKYGAVTAWVSAARSSSLRGRQRCSQDA